MQAASSLGNSLSRDGEVSMYSHSDNDRDCGRVNEEKASTVGEASRASSRNVHCKAGSPGRESREDSSSVNPGGGKVRDGNLRDGKVRESR